MLTLHLPAPQTLVPHRLHEDEKAEKDVTPEEMEMTSSHSET
jgi:hypothetical protein